MPFDQMFQSGLAVPCYLLLGSVVVLLLIACVNVSSLLLARAVQREHEFVVRAAIGASRMRLMRHALAESLVLAMVTMPLAIGFAYVGLQAMLRIVPVETIPDEARGHDECARSAGVDSRGIVYGVALWAGSGMAQRQSATGCGFGSGALIGKQGSAAVAERICNYGDRIIACVADAGGADGALLDDS